jgi:hypothetical protein
MITLADAVEQIGQTGWWWPYQVAFYVFIAFVAVCAWIATRKRPNIRVLAIATTIASSAALGGDALEQIGRYDTTRGARDAVSYGHDYMSTHQLEVLQTLYRFSDNSSYPRQIAGDYLNAASRESTGGGDLRAPSIGTNYSGGRTYTTAVGPIGGGNCYVASWF